VTEVRRARDPGEVEAAFALRRQVFCDEQGVALEDELDARDDEALHIVALDDGVLVGTCRLLVDGDTVTLGRMAVARAERGRGLAGQLLAEAEARARELGARRIMMAAQVSARRVYERAGYEPYGEVFLDAGIDHVMMAKELA
jgi:predicted GNAT family N-acyltransferase